MVQPLETHYDDLQVLRTAPLEVIKASYRVLSQKYHPDRNPHPDALQIMKRVNLAWDVLSDPDRRARHDRWIADNERAPAPAPVSTEARGPKAGANSRLDLDLKHFALRLPLLIGLGLALLVGAVQLYRSLHSAPEEPTDSDGNRIVTADGGRSSPDRMDHGYVQADRQEAPGGTAAIEIDNISGYKDAEVRLYLNGRRVRSAFVHRGLSFSVTDLAPGSYVVKYRFGVFDTVRTYQMNELLTLENAGSVPRQTARVTLFSRTEGMLPGQQIAPDQF